MTLTRKLTLLVAGGLTAFALVTAGALVSYIGAEQSQASAAQNQPAATNTSADSASAREDAYRSQLEAAAGQLREANSRLQQSYDGAQTSGDQPGAATGNGTNNTNDTIVSPVYPVTAEQAAALALKAVPGASLRTAPRLVSFQDTVAYEVGLDQGPVYIDATTGEVLYNGTSATASGPNAAGFTTTGDDHEENESHDGYQGYDDDHGEYHVGDD